MKKKLKILGIAMLVVIGMVSCEKEDNVKTYQKPASEETMREGKWRIDEFEVNGLEVQDYYKDYKFVFKTENVLTAERPNRPLDGEWSVTATEVNITYRIFFGDDQYLNLLNNDRWKVIFQDLTTLQLEGRRGDDGRAEITFKKIMN